MDEDLRGDAPAGLAAVLATLMKQGGAAVEDGPALDLLVEGAITNHRLGGTGRSDLAMKLQALRQWTSRMLRRTGPSVCLVDTTLLASIEASTVGPDPDRTFTSLTLLDLASCAHAVVLYDHVVFLPGAAHAAEILNDKLGVPVFAPLQVPFEADEHGGLLGVGAVLGNLFETVLYELGSVREAKADSAVRADLEAMMKSLGHLARTKFAPRGRVALLARRMGELG
jgi:hypothetical protein